MINKKDFRKISNWLWEIPQSFQRDMRVPARAYISEEMFESVFRDRSISQLINVASLPGIINYSIAMPDMHEGYGFAIGGVAATRVEDGVISPGGVGYDINCTSGNTKVLLEHGAYMPIKRLEEKWKDAQVNYINLNQFKQGVSSLAYFLKRVCNPHILRITTMTGNKIEVTEDHPIFTPEGMKETKHLKENERIAIYPFQGVVYEQPSNKVILSEDNFKKTLLKLGKSNRGSSLQQITNQIQRLQILPLKYNSPQLPYLLKIMGYVLGDGSISFINNKIGIVWFYGEPEDLALIRRDLKKLGFTPSKIYNRTRNHEITTHYQKYKFTRTEYSIKVSSSTFAGLLVALGLPFSLKGHQKYGIPKWIFQCPLWQKRLFLASFFGAELSTPSTLNKYNFYAPQLNMQKARGLERNAKLFLKDIAKLLKEFKVETHTIKNVPGYHYQGKQGETVGFRLQISERAENLIQFFETVSYEYNQQKHREACLAVNYLKRKLKTVGLRAKAREKIKKSYQKRGDFKKIAEKHVAQYVPLQFLYHSIFEENSWGVRKKRGYPRIAFDFSSFEEYKKAYSLGKNGLAWDQIEKIEKVPYKDFVYDFTINNSAHNFIANNIVVSNCGMRLLKSDYLEKDIKLSLDKLATEIQREVPSGLGKGRQIKIDIKSLDRVLEGGAQRLVEQGYGEKEDLENCESQGRLSQADVSCVSDRAKNRGRDQVGTLGSGNHFLEVQKVDEIFDEEIAKAFGLFKDQVVIMIHTGSRGLGHQIATDYIRVMMKAMPKYKINLPDRELAACPLNSPEGRKYFAAMSAGANYAWANRQMIAHFVRKAWKSVLGEKASPLRVLYDVAHNIAKIEKHEVNGKEIEVCLHRKGATRAFPPEHPEIPLGYQKVGQPVIIPGSMGTASYILAGETTGKDAFFSTAHGAGRTMSRHEAMRRVSGEVVVSMLKQKGIIVKCWSLRGIAEEAPLAYKDVDSVVDVVHNAGLSKKVVKLVPLAVIKGE